MLDRILTVGGFTLLSRVTGFMRDIMLAAILGAGPVADAFFIALRLPNHFRAIRAAPTPRACSPTASSPCWSPWRRCCSRSRCCSRPR
jgi:hypothetical protein